MKKSILTSIALALFAFAANAQVSKSHIAKIVALPVLELDLNNVGTDVVFNFATAADYDNGVTINNGGVLKVKSTSAWTMTVKSGQTTFMNGSTATTIPSSSLLVTPIGLSSTGTYSNVPVATTEAAMGDGPMGGNATSGNNFHVKYKLDPGYFAPGTYTMDVTYTLSAL